MLLLQRHGLESPGALKACRGRAGTAKGVLKKSVIGQTFGMNMRQVMEGLQGVKPKLDKTIACFQASPQPPLSWLASAHLLSHKASYTHSAFLSSEGSVVQAAPTLSSSKCLAVCSSQASRITAALVRIWKQMLNPAVPNVIP